MRNRWSIPQSFAILCLSLACFPDAWALEKYGRPFPSMGEVGEEGVSGPEKEHEEHRLRGYLLASAFPYNPTFAARPNNTGLVGMRYMLHLETDIYKDYLQFYTDQNFFSDRTESWLTLSEWDATFAFTGSLGNWGWRLQYERDAPLNDGGGVIQEYGDTLITYRAQDAQQWSWWKSYFPHQNLTAYAGAGWLFYNNSYFARPNNTGLALFRYVAHADLDLYHDLLVFFTDINMFTDKQSSNKVVPTELDLTLGLVFRKWDAEFGVIYERDMPIGQNTLVQKYLALQVRYEFEFIRKSTAAGK